MLRTFERLESRALLTASHFSPAIPDRLPEPAPPEIVSDSPPPGSPSSSDFDGDGDVDGADFVIWQTHFPITAGATTQQGDADGDGDVDGADFVNWQTNFGSTDSPPPDPDPNPPPDPDPNPEPNWFDNHIADSGLKILGSSLYRDGLIDRADVMSLFASAQDDDSVDATEFQDLTAIVNNVLLFGDLDHVWKLSTYVVLGSIANANYQGSALGNLAADSTGQHLQNLVNKWFLGLDRPAAGASYSLVSGSLFVDGVSYTDAVQGGLNNCGIIAALAEIAFKSPQTITDMFIVNGDGTYTVRFYNGTTAEYVTVGCYLPNGGNTYARVRNGELWVALAEKACAQLNEFTWCGFGFYVPVGNSYASIEWTYIRNALSHVVGQTARTYWMKQSDFTDAVDEGKMICFASKSTGTSSGVVANHAYALISYDQSSQLLTLYNPWGSLITLTWSEVQSNFSYFECV